MSENMMPELTLTPDDTAAAAADGGRESSTLAGLDGDDRDERDGQDHLNNGQNDMQSSHNSSKLQPPFIGKTARRDNILTQQTK